MSVAGLIDWPAALLLTHATVSRVTETEQAVGEALAHGPVFRNRDFPLSPVPVLVRQDRAALLRPLLARYVDLLGTVVARWREQARVRDFFRLGPAAERLVAADRALGDAPWVCRLDGYLEAGSERLRVLENNADSPAGTLFTARINETVAAVVRRLHHGAGRLADLTYTGEDRFLDGLRAAARAAAAREPGRCADPARIAVLQPTGAANRESVELVDRMRAVGVDAFLADPRTVEVVGGRTRFGARPADLCWNKVNTVSWMAYCADPDFVTRWERAVRDTALVHVNPFGARYVAENKLTLALVQEPGFADLFTPQQRALVDALLPWSRKLTPDAVDDGGTPLVDRLLADPRDFVLKQPYDIRGDGVTIGHDCPPGRWRAAVAEGVRDGHLVQRRVAPTSYPVVVPGAERVTALPISLDTYLLGGHVAGFGAKASRNSKINIFQGGQKLAVHVVAGGFR
ncbi:hypothetical protein AWW66_08885 [Micromonospora rosaria]|uniref:Glutathionylspermidine synthase pre-ATP-grasp-like domain-containing protein n=1 Tax=Micromonospora rosaria TaxID=47874 RepID=A0A136PVC1_9ACTN|nr:hypothetical protein [Micromonospora rosaria]KXK62335.1 hypothetical protein AWW66_08885 [Micromonospora rosaria]